MINRFAGEWDVLSSFYPAPFMMKDVPGHWFPTAEHAFQCGKAVNLFDFQKILHADGPAKAKRLGRDIPIKPDWDDRRREHMLRVIMAKFDSGSVRAQQLIATGTEVLVEGNTWNDVYWGAVPSPLTVSFRRGPGYPEGELPVWRAGGYASEWLVGCNWLGRLLMMWREVISP